MAVETIGRLSAPPMADSMTDPVVTLSAAVVSIALSVCLVTDFVANRVVSAMSSPERRY